MAYQPVRDHYAVLTSHMLIDPLLPYLKHQNWLTPQEYDMLVAVPNTHYKQKMELIVRFLHQKNGRVVCDEVFVRCIIWSGQFDLAKLLGYTEHYMQQVLQCQPLPAAGNTWTGNDIPIPGPYPPPPGVHNVSPVRKWSPGEPGTAVDVRRKRVPSSEVLHPTCIIYSKDDDPSNHVCDLSDFLNYCGVDCDIDQYHASENILDWGGWIETMIKSRASRKGYVLLVCSPKLHQKLSNSSSSILRIEMRAGHISNLTLNTLIKDDIITYHIIPIFLEQYRKEYVPACLAGRSWYSVCITKVLELSNHSASIDAVLNAPELESLQSLVYRLRGEQMFIKPSHVIPSPTPGSTPMSPGNFNISPAVSPVPPTFVSPEPSPQHKSPQNSQQQQLGHSPKSPTINPIAQLPRKLHRTEVEGEVMDEFLQKVADNIGRDWSRLGVRLGIEFRTLEQIRHSVPYDIRQQAYLMLVQWKETHKTVATMVELQDKLDELKLGRIGRLSTRT